MKLHKGRFLKLFATAAVLVLLLSAGSLTAKALSFTDGWETSSKYTWLNGAFNTQDSDRIYEGTQAYDWTVTVQQSRTTVQVTVQATIMDASGNLIDQVNQTATCNKSYTPSVVLAASDFTKLTTSLTGNFTLVCDILYNGSSVARMTQSFSRSDACQHSMAGGVCTLCGYPLLFNLTDAQDGYTVFECRTSATGDLIIPATYRGLPVTAIGNNVFSWCTSLTSLVVEKGNAVYHSAGNCLIETKTKILITGCQTSQIPSDGSVTSIGSCEFDG